MGSQRGTEGFVLTTKGGVKSWHFALRYSKGKVARFQKNGTGIWCSSHVAKRFFEFPWAGIESMDQVQAAWDKAMELMKQQAEMDRMITPNGWRANFECKICGAQVDRQVLHFNWHQRMNLIDPAFHLTVDLLFGDDAVAQQAAVDASKMITELFGGQ